MLHQRAPKSAEMQYADQFRGLSKGNQLGSLDLNCISKAFPGVLALDRVSMFVDRGEVHALLGENGAGKSTLLKILAGAQTQDSGTIKFRGELLPKQSPLRRQNEGIVTIYQEFNLLPNLSVADNIFIGREPLRGIFIDRVRMHSRAREVLAQLGLELDPGVLVKTLSVAEQQMVEIARALAISADLIIMDEPTAALSEREVAELHSVVRGLQRKGVAVVYVTHRLNEVFDLCDRFTVLRDGRPAGSGKVSDVKMDDLIRMMVGRKVEPCPAVPSLESLPPMLEVRDFITKSRVRLSRRQTGVPLSITVRCGEVVGIAGLVGAGRTEFVRAIFGADARQAGTILVGGQLVEITSPADALRSGIALVPEDRKQEALFLTHSVKNNFSLPSLRTFCKFGWFVSEAEEERYLLEFGRKLRIRMHSPNVAIATLSGGNQQKVILARCMAIKPKVLIVDEPTRGIDIGSKVEVHEMIAALAREGVAVLVISSELPELLSISHRIVVMREGAITGELSSSEAREERLMSLMALPADHKNIFKSE